MKSEQKLSTYWKFSIIFFTTLLCFWGVFVAGDILLLSLLGLGMGVLMTPIIRFAKKRTRLPHTIGAVLIILLVSLPFLGVLYWVGNVVFDQFDKLIQELPQHKERLTALWQQGQQEYPFLRRMAKGLDLESGLPNASSITNTLFKGISSMGSLLTAGLYVLILCFFSAIRMESYYRGFVNFFAPAHRRRVAEYCESMAESLRACFLAQLIDMLVVGVLTTLGLWLVGFHYWPLLGVFTGLFCIIPYVGLFLALIAATLLALSTQPSLVFAVWGVYFFSQFIEGNIIMPYVMRKRVQLPEVPLLVALFVGAKWFGLLGAFMAPALLAVGLAALKQLQQEQGKVQLRRVA